MKTVKEVSELTGVSIRTLRYYDEIDLLKPAKVTEAGYRLYDENSLKKLRQILFFRELEVSLSEIKAIMKDYENDNRKILETQKMMLEMKRNHLNGIIEWISDVLKGEDKMSFEAFHVELNSRKAYPADKNCKILLLYAERNWMCKPVYRNRSKMGRKYFQIEKGRV